MDLRLFRSRLQPGYFGSRYARPSTGRRRPHLNLPLAHYQAGGVEATYLRCACGAKVMPATEEAYLRHLAEAIRAAKVGRVKLARRGGGRV